MGTSLLPATLIFLILAGNSAEPDPGPSNRADDDEEEEPDLRDQFDDIVDNSSDSVEEEVIGMPKMSKI